MPNRFMRRPDGVTGSIPHDITVNVNYDAAGGIVDTWAFVADADYEVTKVYCIPRVVGSDGSAVTADVMKVTGAAAAPSAGATVCSAADSLNLKGTADTVQTGTLTTTRSSRRLAAGDRLGINFTGTLTAAVGLIQINLKRIQSSQADR